MLVFVEREKYSINSGVHTQATLARDERSHHCTISAQGGFELNVEGNSLLLQFYITVTMAFHWSKKLALLSQPIRSNAEIYTILGRIGGDYF